MLLRHHKAISKPVALTIAKKTTIPTLYDMYLPSEGSILFLEWSPTGRYLAYVAAAHNTEVQIVDVRKRRHVRAWHEHADPLCAIAWSPDGRRMAVVTEDGTVKIGNMIGERTISALSEKTPLSGFWTSGYRKPGYGLWSLTWSPDGERLLVGNRLYLCMYNVDSTEAWKQDSSPVFRITTASVRAIAWLEEGMLIAEANAQALRVLRPLQDDRLYQLPGVTRAAWSPDGRLAIACADGTAQTLLAATYRGHSGQVHAVAWSPKGRWVASSADDGMIHVWCSVMGTPRLTWQTGAPATTLAWSPDGKRIAWGTSSGHLCVLPLAMQVRSSVSEESLLLST